MTAKQLIIKNPDGLSFEFLENGSVKSIEADPIRISLKATTLYSRPGTNIYLRKRSSPFEFTALMGPESNSNFSFIEGRYLARGSWAGIEYTCALQLSGENLSWQWIIEIENTFPSALELDLIYVQDIGLKPLNSGLINEYYVSQYLERRMLEDKKYGPVLCCRQNMKESTGHPWLMLGCRNGAIAACTDGMQFYGKTCRETGIPEGLHSDRLGGEYAGESSVIALQEKPFILAEGESHTSVFVATYLPDHPDTTSSEDLKRLHSLFIEFGNGTPSGTPSQFNITHKNLFNPSSFLPINDLNNKELNDFFGNERRHPEKRFGKNFCLVFCFPCSACSERKICCL